MKTIEKIISNPILIFVIMSHDLFQIGKSLLNIQSVSAEYNWIDFFIKLVLAVSLWAVLRAYVKLKNDFNDRMKVFNVVSHIRNKRLFVKSFEGVEFLRMPNETDQELQKRLPEYGLFNEFYKEEYQIVKNVLQKKMREKSIEEIEKLLSEYYPINQKQKVK